MFGIGTMLLITGNVDRMSEKRAGIYKLEFRTGEIYIGQSISVDSRIKTHLKYLGRGTHGNKDMQELYNLYGSPDTEIIELCAPELLNQEEKKWIAYYDSYNNGLNKTNGGGIKRKVETTTREPNSFKWVYWIVLIIGIGTLLRSCTGR
jgi:hypothetical protein